MYRHTSNFAYEEQHIGIQSFQRWKTNCDYREGCREVFSVLQQYFESKGWILHCLGSLVSNLSQLEYQAEQMECKIFQLVAATIKMTKHSGKKIMFL